MSTLIDLAASLGPWSWIIAGVILMALETVIPGVYFLWFGISAVVVGLLTFVFGDALSHPWQLVLFALVSVATVIWIRNVANLQQVESEDKDLNQRSAQYLGRIVVVEDAITGAHGIVFTVEPA